MALRVSPRRSPQQRPLASSPILPLPAHNTTKHHTATTTTTTTFALHNCTCNTHLWPLHTLWVRSLLNLLLFLILFFSTCFVFRCCKTWSFNRAVAAFNSARALVNSTSNVLVRAFDKKPPPPIHSWLQPENGKNLLAKFKNQHINEIAARVPCGPQQTQQQ